MHACTHACTHAHACVRTHAWLHACTQCCTHAHACTLQVRVTELEVRALVGPKDGAALSVELLRASTGLREAVMDQVGFQVLGV